MSERVEVTISKGVLRIGGTAVGGTLGFLVMLNPRLATDPYLLMVPPRLPAKALPVLTGVLSRSFVCKWLVKVI